MIESESDLFGSEEREKGGEVKDHYSLWALIDFVDGKLNGWQRFWCAFHLKRCAQCWKQFEKIAEEKQQLQSFRSEIIASQTLQKELDTILPEPSIVGLIKKKEMVEGEERLDASMKDVE